MAVQTSGPVHARQSLQERAASLLSDAFESTENPAPTVVWWDRGGHLREVLREACSSLDGVRWREASGLPLSLRRYTPEDADVAAVWYVPEAKNGRRWFKDLEETGGEIEYDIVGLAADVYGVARWELSAAEAPSSTMAEIAPILEEELTRPHRPSLDELKEELLTRGHGSPFERLLITDWGQTSDPSTLDQLRSQLRDEGVPDISEDDGPAKLAERCRRWVVALWLQEAGVDPDRFPDGYRADSSLHTPQQRLRDRMREADGRRTERLYLHERWWPDVVDSLKDPVRVASCPVDGSLDARLWEEWAELLEAGESEAAVTLARTRSDALAHVYPSDSDDGVVHRQCWDQAVDIAEVAGLYETLADALELEPPTEVYCREEDGAWRVDAAVRRLVVGGEPERRPPDWSPGSEVLGTWRAEMTGARYLSHLQQLADRTQEAVADGSFFQETECVTGFWSADHHKGDLAAGQEVALIVVDGLRFDLAHELAGRLRSDLGPDDGGDGVEGREEAQSWSVRTSRWRATVPSETEPGMGALLPGSTKALFVDVADGKLRARRSQRYLTADYRAELLEEEGLTVTRDWKDDWRGGRTAFLDSDIDQGGEAGFDRIEEHLDDCVDDLADRIAARLRQGGWEKAFVVTDHGFVLLPPGFGMEALDPPDEAEAVTRRYAAPAGRDEGYGVRLEPGAPGLEYLETSLRVLVHPQQRFSKRGLPDRRYFHGGLSPQESLLLFLEIERT
jgi:hypothetical protein